MADLIIGAGRIVTPADVLAPGHVAIAGDRLEVVGAGIPADADRVYPEGTLVPGFVDLQVNGGAGVDLLDCDEGGVERVSRYLAATGTTAFLATLISAPLQQVRRAVETLRRARPQGAEILGVHIEGPAINPSRAGAHDRQSLRAPDDPEVQQMLADAFPNLRLVTLAPELPGAGDLITWLTGRGVVVSLGHTDATYQQAGEAFRRGARMVTHLFNGMRGLHHREPGVVGAAFDDPQCICGLIADGIHVHPAVVRLAFSALGPERVALVTDATGGAGMSPGEYLLAGRPVRVAEGDAPRLPDGGLAGSVLRMDDALRNLIAWGIPLGAAVHSAAVAPARVLGLRDRGAVAEGMRADLTVLGEDGRAVLTVVAGRVVYRREPEAE